MTEKGTTTLLTVAHAPPEHNKCNHVYDLHIKKETIEYLHACCFSPAPGTWKKAIRQGYFTTWPGLTEKLVQKRLPKCDATDKGHLDQQRKT
eukprot:14107854-Ditylum_brightwellii.AAC.1